MKKPRFSFFPTSCSALVLALASSLLLSISSMGQDINEFTTGNNLGTGSSWSQASAPTGNANAGSHKDILFTTPSTLLSHSGTFIYARSHNATNGTSYTIQSNRAATDPPTLTTFRIGSTGSTAPLPTTFTNSFSGIENDLIVLSNNSNLTYEGANPVEGGPAPVINLPLATGNFNVSEGSTLNIGMTITGNGAIVINGNGTTVLSGDRTGSGATTVNGGSLVISGTHTGTGTFNLNNGSVLISGNRAGGGTNVRNGTFEITGTNGGTGYTIANTVDNVEANEPVLKLSNVNAVPLTATITGADSVARDGVVDLAVAGSYTMGSYVRGNIAFTASNGSPTSLTFTNASAIMISNNSTRSINNNSANLGIVFASTLDIGGTVAGTATMNGAGNFTVAGGITSVGDGVRNLIKNGSGTLTINGASTYTGTTTLGGGLMVLGHATAIPGGIGATGGTSNLLFNGTTGIIGLTAASGDFLRPLGTGPDQVTANPTADSALVRRIGFAAYGGDRIVDFGASIQLSSTSHAGRGLNLGAADSDSKVTLVNGINLVNSSRPVVVANGSAAVDAELSGVISHAGGTLVKSGAGTLALTGANTYGSESGGTEVLDGVLIVDGDSLSDDSKLVIDGGKVQSTGTETVDTLFFGDVQQIAGTWGSSASSAEPAFQDDTRFSGTGVVVVTTGPSSEGYDIWAGDNAGGQTADLDFDNDGVPNGVEYFMGETGSSFTSNPGVIAGTVTWPRDPDAVATFKVQVSDTLAVDDWQDIVPPHASIDETNPNQVVFTVPTEGPKNFCRLVVTP